MSAMDGDPRFDQQLQVLQERIDHLENVNRWHMDALGMLVAMGEIHGDANTQRDPQKIYAMTREYVRRLADFAAVGFMAVNEEDSSFELVDDDSGGNSEHLERLIEPLIERGEFAWALSQNRPVEVRVEGGSERIVLHVLSTRTRVRGMFVGLLAEGAEIVSGATLSLLSVILYNAAYALESAALYNLISNHNRNLKSIIETRTRELEHQYGHDSLTGLPNRILFQDRIRQAMVRANNTQRMLAVVMIDLDMFKRINDTLGHAAGDELLKQVSRRLLHCLHDKRAFTTDGVVPSITLARLGGDEFGILLGDIDSIEPINRVTRRVIGAFSESIKLDGQEVYSTCSVGISLYPSDGRDPESLLKNADVAMYHAKRQGRNGYHFYSREMDASSFHHLKLENELRFAIEREEFLLHYQPKVDLRSGRMTGVEALLRWDHPENGLVAPAEFIPIAEYTGLIVEIGEWVLRTACRQVRKWIDMGYAELEMAVNLSPQQFRRRDILERIVAIVHECELPPGALEIEITESAIMEDVDRAVVTMRELNRNGVRLAIDDFGTGYSSLAYLKRFPLDNLKIDRSFVSGLPGDMEDAAIVDAIVAMGHRMGLKVIAEGVETVEQLGYLRGLQCDEIQGYLFSPPVPAEHLLQMLKSDKRL